MDEDGNAPEIPLKSESNPHFDSSRPTPIISSEDTVIEKYSTVWLDIENADERKIPKLNNSFRPNVGSTSNNGVDGVLIKQQPSLFTSE